MDRITMTPTSLTTVAAALLMTAGLTAAAQPAAPTADAIAFFEKKIRPVLIEHCYKCHSEKSEKLKGGLLLDTRDGLLRGGDTGPAITPGDPRKSLLIAAVRWDDKDLQMPPKKKLPPEVIADLEKWISMGASDPRKGAAMKPDHAAKKPDAEAAKQWWSFQPVVKLQPPQVKDAGWPRGAIDRFILAEIEARGLKPVADADKRTLVRRLYFDLVGLPPVPEVVDAFVKDTSAGAVETLVDRLFASPQFGEKWGRHWLDVARFAESAGKERNTSYPHAWKYRDYVIDAFNASMPYDRFLMEQIAGDLMPAADAAQRGRQQIATGFLAIGPKSVNTRDRRQFALDVADEQIDAVSQSMLGLTIACARCHDHKFDPIPTRDYYALAGIFLSSETCYGGFRTVGILQSSSLIELPDETAIPPDPAITAADLQKLEDDLAKTRQQRDEMMKELRASRTRSDGNLINRYRTIMGRVEQLENKLESYHDDGRAKKLAMGVRDTSRPADSPIYLRGETDKAGETVPRGFPQAIASDAPPITRGSGRLELAHWIASPKNPLTARVMVNRVWSHLLGQGIVASVDNFGVMGQKPTHPALLDYLAADFVEQGWSVKKLIKQIVLSRVYQLGSDHSDSNYAADPDNTWLWRMSKRRLDAEQIRDAMLAASGQLDLERPVGSPMAKVGEGIAALVFGNAVGAPARFSMYGGSGAAFDPNSARFRSVYMPIVRDQVVESLDVFDFAEPSLVTGQRQETTVPSQALYMMNSPLVLQQAGAMARRITADESRTQDQRIAMAFELAYGRPPTPPEAAAVSAFMERFMYAQGRGLTLEAWTALCQSLFAAAEFRYLN